MAEVSKHVMDLLHGGPKERSSAAGRMLAKGGVVDDEEVEESAEEIPEALIACAAEIMEILGSGGFISISRDDDSRVEKAGKEASKKAKAKILAEALKAFFLMVDVDD